MSAQVIIIGQTRDGKKFRPSDWTERLYYAVASYGPHGQVTFNPFVTIRVKDDNRCVVVDTRLQANDPIIYSFVIGFARDNSLMVVEEGDQPPLAA